MIQMNPHSRHRHSYASLVFALPLLFVTGLFTIGWGSAPDIIEVNVPEDTDDLTASHISQRRNLGAIDRARVEWTVEPSDSTATRLAMKRIKANHWEVQLPAMKAGSKISMRIQVIGPGGEDFFPLGYPCF